MSLSNIPSELIRTALADLRKIESDSRYCVNMDAWHQYEDGTCFVCLAGAVMAQRLGADPSVTLGVFHYPSGITSKLRALNQFRLGAVGYGLELLGYECPATLRRVRVVTPYSVDSEKFHADMERLAHDLEVHDL